jgi:hypothetical protein
VRRREEEAAPRRIKFGEKKSKPQQRMEGYTILHNDYFADDTTHADNFRHRYRMSNGLFMNILHGVREFEPYFKLKHGAVALSGSHRFRSAPSP